MQGPKVSEAQCLPNVPSQFSSEVRRLIRSRAFLEQVKEILQWPYIRFTGIVFRRMPINAEFPDGVPDALRPFQRRADYKFVDIPPGVMLRARSQSRAEVDAEIKLCALFETYGIDAEHLEEMQRTADEADEDSLRQIRAWSDVGQSMRTETDLSNRSIPELFVEDISDLYD